MGDFGQEGDGDSAVGYAEVGLVNSSSSVAYDLRMQLTCDPLIAKVIHPEGPLNDPQFIVHGHVAALSPGRWTAAIRLPRTEVQQASLVMFFADQSDTYWLRGPAGELSESDVPAAPFKSYLRDYEHGQVDAIEVHKVPVQRLLLRSLD
ncbi:MAG: hypothetical protein JWR37_2126 [Mycobacterium sp.]|nr:hypothetical protein [Mycobacterium sp.]